MHVCLPSASACHASFTIFLYSVIIFGNVWFYASQSFPCFRIPVVSTLHIFLVGLISFMRYKWPHQFTCLFFISSRIRSTFWCSLMSAVLILSFFIIRSLFGSSQMLHSSGLNFTFRVIHDSLPVYKLSWMLSFLSLLLFFFHIISCLIIWCVFIVFKILRACLAFHCCLL